MKDHEQYCPICGRVITADNKDRVDDGLDDGYLFIHDDIVHEDSDIEALSSGIN